MQASSTDKQIKPLHKGFLGGSEITLVIPTSTPHTVRLHYSKEYNSHWSTTTLNTLELDGSNTQPREQRLQKLSTTAQTTKGAQRLQIEHDGPNHTSKCVNTQADCVDTTGFNYSDCFLEQSSSVDTQVTQLMNAGGKSARVCAVEAVSTVFRSARY
ncbi:hypothetical protein Taro_005795 [Colocasia esculenta]|uniref:Uncharacterized protein n=1 Tax=Colocasia esculenta TaxID=4460 RepID=A0A843TVJ3_COLES|nr:hypothetical protein [Colocasia esculenta]